MTIIKDVNSIVFSKMYKYAMTYQRSLSILLWITLRKTWVYVTVETMNAMAFKIHRILKVFAVCESVMVTYG